MTSPRFDIKGIIDQVGESLTLTDITITTSSDRGDVTTTTSDKTINGYIDEMTAEEKEVEEGLLALGDIIVYIDEDETNVAYLENGNYFTRDSKKYQIKNVVHNLGHYQVFCKRQ